LEASQNGDLSVRVDLDTTQLDWQPSPSGTVHRKRLHRVGPAEAGQVTSLVRYEPGASFHEHPHPEGEEILVLDGVFSDEHGDWKKGTYLLNPEGFSHAPFSREGCLLFVKLRQYPGRARTHVALDTCASNSGTRRRPCSPSSTTKKAQRSSSWPVTSKTLWGTTAGGAGCDFRRVRATACAQRRTLSCM
jgi:hypothetical protein